jgi:hypothetical protein
LLLLLQTIIPLGIKANNRAPSTGTPNYKFTGGRLNTTILFDPMAGMGSNGSLTCEALQEEMPNSESGVGATKQRNQAAGWHLQWRSRQRAAHGLRQAGLRLCLPSQSLCQPAAHHPR